MSTKKKDRKDKNTKYIDLLDEDKNIAGQKFVCLSFISPEEHIKNKELFLFQKYLENFDMRKSIEKFNNFINFITYKYNIDSNKILKDLDEFLIEEKDNIFQTTIEDDYKTFLDNSEDKYIKEYNQKFDFQTTTRGVKVRGSFETQEEAEMKCKMLREEDPNHDVYVGHVGKWLPFHPEAYKTGKVEYLESELNQLMAEKKKNDEISKENFKKRVKESKKTAIDENIKKAEKHGNKLMQSIDEDGNLINKDKMDVPGKNLLFGDGQDDDVSTSNLRKELFNDENVIVGRQANNDHGLSRIKDFHKKNEEMEQLAAMADGMESVSEPPKKDPINIE
tara:strand:- start:641 stop:1645 length:1005 start_codon:yes stop_codon:yes gene_type:complete